MHLELLLPCTVLDARELVPSNSALPRPETPAASVAAAVGPEPEAERKGYGVLYKMKTE